jgi:hypothetical protein
MLAVTAMGPALLFPYGVSALTDLLMVISAKGGVLLGHAVSTRGLSLGQVLRFGAIQCFLLLLRLLVDFARFNKTALRLVVRARGALVAFTFIDGVVGHRDLPE